MFTGLIVTLLIFLFIIFFIFYKKDMLIRIFSLKLEEPTVQFQNQLQETADAVIDRLETQITHLEYLLEEADKRIDILNRQIEQSEHLIANAPVFNTIESAKPVVCDLNNKDSLPNEAATDIKILDYMNKQESIEEKNRRQLVLELAEQGYTVTEIAKATSIGKGEIMLLLQLNKK